MTEKPAQKNKLAVQHYEDRPVGSLQEPDLSAMTKEERDARRDTVERLSDLFKKAEKGNVDGPVKAALDRSRRRPTIGIVHHQSPIKCNVVLHRQPVEQRYSRAHVAGRGVSLRQIERLGFKRLRWRDYRLAGSTEEAHAG